MLVKLQYTYFWEIMFSLKTKKSTGHLSCPALQLSTEWAFLVDFPIDQFYFFKLRDIDSSSNSFMVIYDIDSGTLASSEPQHSTTMQAQP